VDKKNVDQNGSEQSGDDAAHKAEELMEAAAYSKQSEARLWRLEWAQAFRKLAELSRDRKRD
jgi:hypothetical protein